jgi:outer membrane receptor protein involved in Fe transport
VLLAGAMALAASQAHAQAAAPPPAATQGKAPAQAAPAAKKPDSGKTVEGLTVTGASQNGMRSSIDRRSYGVANDLATTTGSISDALKNIPAVEVDPQGNVSLRGDQNVTILVDGKPSGQFKGASAAQALQAMPADSVERVEVITNPSAEFSPEGAAGIINLVTKKNRKPGKSGSVRLNVGDGGRSSAGVTWAYNSNKLTLSADANGRYDPQSVDGSDVRSLLDGQGRVLTTNRTRNHNEGHLDLWGGRASADYDLDAKTRLSGEVRFNHFDIDMKSRLMSEGDDVGGAIVRAFTQPGRFAAGRGDGAVQASLRRSLTGDDHVLTVNVSREHIDEARDNAFSQIFSAPANPDLFADIRGQNSLTQSQAKADYIRPMPDEGKLKAGYDLRIDDNQYDLVGLRGTAAANAAPDPTQTNLFLDKQTVNAAYATYERPFGDWTVLGGLRLEDVRLDLNQVTSHLAGGQKYFRAYPSLHLAYKVSDDQQLILSYSRRVQRPNPEDLNPFRVENDPLNFRAGNPDLQPQTTDSFEAGYQYKSGGTFYLGTLYYRQNDHGVTDVLTPLAGDVLLTTKANLSRSKAAGLELVANGRVTKTLTYNVSTNLYWNEIDATGQGLDQLIGFAGRRSAFAVGGRGSLTWQATPKDTVQVSVNVNAKRLTPQGFVEPFALTFIGYRHKFDDNLFGVVTVQDPFQGLRFRQVIDSPTLRDRNDVHVHIRGVFVGFTRTFGSNPKRPREPTFDFGGAAAPTP